MAANDPQDLEKVDQQIRINELKETAREAAGGDMTEWESDDMPDEMKEQFWGNVAAYETAPDTTNIEMLERAGIKMPAPGTMDDEQLHAKLWEVINGLAKMSVFLSHTDHLDDRALYTVLFERLLREDVKDMPPDSGWVDHLDILGGCSKEDSWVFAKYYADKDEEGDYFDMYQEDPPPHEDPPHDRDQHLPEGPFP